MLNITELLVASLVSAAIKAEIFFERVSANESSNNNVNKRWFVNLRQTST